MSHNLLLDEVGPGEELPGFDIDDPILPREIAANALRSGSYPYGVRMKRGEYKRQELPLQVELVKLQRWVQKERQRLVIIFEGRDAAGKGGTIIRCSAFEADRNRARRVVFPVLCRAPALGRQHGRVRSLLVQPRRRRAGARLLY